MSEKQDLQAINLREDDELIEVKFTDNNKGYLPCDKIWPVYPVQGRRMSERQDRVSMGVIGMNLSDG